MKEQDGLFRNMDVDPQNVKIVGGKSLRLPEEWNNTRLGHNFSLVCVCKHIGGAIDMGHSQGIIGSGYLKRDFTVLGIRNKSKYRNNSISFF